MNRRHFMRTMFGTALFIAVNPSISLETVKIYTEFDPNRHIIGPSRLSQIVGLEWERMAPHMRRLFERDDVFYRVLKAKDHTYDE